LSYIPARREHARGLGLPSASVTASWRASPAPGGRAPFLAGTHGCGPMH